MSFIFKFPKPSPAQPGEVNYDWYDRFTLAHFAIGMIYGYFGFHIILAFMLAILWEAVENPLKYYLPKVFPHGTADTWKNIIGDTLAVMAGWAWMTL